MDGADPLGQPVRRAERLKGAGSIAVGLVGLAALLLVFAPETDHQPEAPPSPQAGTRFDPPAPAADSPVVRPGRNVAPPSITQRGDLDETPLRRVQPPPAAPTETAPAAAADQPTKIRLLAQPVAVAAGTIAIGAGVIALPGLRAPALEQRCSSGSVDWPCGVRARTELRAYLRGRSIRCAVPEDFGTASETVTASCTLGGSDIGEWLVRHGWAEAEAGGPYADAEAEAKRERRGLWR